MGLVDSLHKDGIRLTKEHYSQIRPNKHNRAPITEVKELAYLIKEYGQIEPIIVYVDETLSDGAKYTILGGERRYSAIKLNSENGEGDGMVNMYIYPKPKGEWEELSNIRVGNTYRTKTPESIQLDVLECEKEYINLCERGQKPAGLKRDWIGKECGISGRRADDYLKMRKQSVSVEAMLAEDGEESDTNKPNKEKKPKQLKDVIKLLSNGEKQIEKAMIMAEKLEETEAFHDISYVLNKVRETLYSYKEKTE